MIDIARKDIIWNYIGTILVMGANFIMLPFLFFYLNSSLLGLWQIFQSIGSVALLLNFGFSPTLARNVAYICSGTQKLLKEGVEKSTENSPNLAILKNVLETCKRIYFIIAVIAGLLLITAGTFYIIRITSIDVDHLFWTAWFIYIASICFNLYYCYYSSFLIGVGAIAENNKARVFASIAQIIITIILLYFGVNILAPAVAYFFYGAIYRMLAKRYFYNYDCLGEQLEKISEKNTVWDTKQMFLTIWHNAWKDGMVSLSTYLVGQANTIICSIFFSLEETGMYSLSLQFVTAIGIVATTLYSTYQPRFQALYAKEEYNKIIDLLSVVLITYCVIFIGGIFVLLCIGIPILTILKPNYYFSNSMIVILGFYTFFRQRSSIYTSYISNTNRIPYVKSFFVTGIFSVVLAVVTSAYLPYRIWGLIASQFLSQAIYNNWKWPLEVKRELNTSTKEMVCRGMVIIRRQICKKYYL